MTIMIAATPREIPIIENQENTDIYPSVFFEKINLKINNLSIFENTNLIIKQFLY